MQEYLLEKLKQYGASDVYPLHMPGHKRRICSFGDPFAIDITEIDGFDNLHHAQGILLEAQRRAARLYGAEETYYLVNGSTCGILAAVAAQTGRGERLLMARNCHRSVYHAVFLNGLRAVYLYPPVDAAHGICGSVRSEDVEEALRKNPDIRAVLVTSPTYDGVVSDIRAIAGAAHRAGAVLIVDEAHGAHFGMHPCFPRRALACGADIVINSLHKTLPSLTQTALLHVQGDRADREKLRKYLGIYQSSSPSYVLMAGMDACVRLLAEQGDGLFDAFATRLARFRERMKELRVLRLLDAGSFPPGEIPDPLPCRPRGREPGVAPDMRQSRRFAYDFDCSRVLISTERSAMAGPELAGILRRRYRLEPEMAAEHYVTAIMTVADTQEGFDRLAAALIEIDARLCAERETSRRDGTADAGCFGQEGDVGRPAGSGSSGEESTAATWESYPVNEEVLSLQEAEESAAEQLPLSDSAGRVSAEYIYLYPPGIPLLVPGERISEELLRRLGTAQAAGLELQGMTDKSGRIIRAVREAGSEKYAQSAWSELAEG